ncbi:MAG: hypothetical protein JSV19_09345 [Phycisphaerales bacterium]|nr:MAG: hypothetical protein JSV19_09345 [Phycisphaerales bacterium]
MMSDLFGKWLDHYDPIHLGYTPRGIANGVCATGGWFFPRITGGYNLYRGSPGAGEIDYGRPVGAAGTAATEIRNFPWCLHASNTTYAYVVRSIGGGGVESDSSAPPVSVEIDALGTVIGPRPNAPSQLSVRPAADGAFDLRWTYSTAGEAAPPMMFRIFSDQGTGAIDFDTVVGSVAYRAGQVHYAFTTPTHAHGTRRLWAVRAVSVDDVDDGNSVAVSAWADAEPPPVCAGLIARRGGEY